MKCITIKRKEFEIVEIIKNNSFKCSFKDKFYFVKHYNMKKSSEESKFNNCLKLNKSAVNFPRIFLSDKRSGYIAFEYLDGVLLSDYILENDFDENIYRQVFMNSYMAKAIRLQLDFSLDQWMMVKSTLFYVGDYCESYQPEKDFTKTQIREWFLSKELVKFYENKGILFDKSRVKDDYAVNKEMVLMTCKYYV